MGLQYPAMKIKARRVYKIMVPEVEKCVDIGNACNDRGHESWATIVEFRRLDGPSHGKMHTGHEVGIFSCENGMRLDVGAGGGCTADAGHDSWATRLQIIPQHGERRALSYGEPCGIFSEEADRRLDFGPCAADGGHDSWATKFRVHEACDNDSDSHS